MSGGKETKRRTSTIELKSELLAVLEEQYESSRSMQISFTAYVNTYLENYIKKQRLLKKLYPFFSVILSAQDKGFYIKDYKKEQVAEITTNTRDPSTLLKCNLDKDKIICPHIEYALLSFELMNMFETSLNDPEDNMNRNDEKKVLKGKETKYVLI